VLKIHLASAPAARHGWLRALHDPVVAPALAAMHAHPEHRWTIAELARLSLVSPTRLDERFREVLGLAPIRYLTGWRMHIAESLLHSTDLPVAVVARRVGYEAEESFGRAFKRAHDEAPSAWRVHR
jgi:AraC-like DNA-binding protein